MTQGATGILGGTAYDFDGTDDYVYSTIDTSSWSAYTASAWVRPQSFSSWQSIISFGLSGSNVDVRVGLFDNSGDGNYDDIIVSQSDGSTFHNSYANDVFANEWVHVCLRWDGSTQECFLDGNSIVTQSVSNLRNSGNDVEIARSVFNQGRHLNGKISEVRIYDHALTPAEVQYLYSVSQHGQLTSSWKQA